VRIAALYDIHGNLPALEAVLDEVRGTKVDRIVVGGDLFPGPMAHHTLARLLDGPTHVDFIYGNGDVALVQHLSGQIPSLLPESSRPIIKWNADHLDADQCRLVVSWPMTLRLTIPPLGEVLFCHATPRNENEIFTRTTAEGRLTPIFDSTNAAVVVCGHTHMPFDRIVGKTRVVNAGSVGMPFGRTGADWLLLGPDVELRHTSYDLDAAVDRIRRSGYPQADEFATKYVLQPPSETEMLTLYAKHELT
jgi:predicted phosphodiesterase